MATKKKLLQAAAGTAAASGGAGALNVEDVFSTYLYEGNGSAQVIENGINLGQSYGSGSVEFEQNSSYLKLPSEITLTGDFTIEAMVWSNSGFTSQNQILGSDTGGGSNLNTQVYIQNTTNYLSLYDNGAAHRSTSAVPQDQWVHIAITRSGSTVTFYINGTASGTSSTSATIAVWAVGALIAGATVYEDYYGYISNVRIVDGSVVYTSNFTPPTSDLTAITNTQLLTCQGDSPFVDNSSNSYALTATNTPIAKTFGPFDAADAGEGGLVWIKNRTTGGSGYEHSFIDSERGVDQWLTSNSTGAQVGISSWNISFNANGWGLNVNNSYANNSSSDYASWTFRKAPKFFDVVTYTGNGTARTINHNLGSVPGCIIIKRLNTVSGWSVYHRGANGGTNPEQYILELNETGAQSASAWMQDTAPTSTEFSINTYDSINNNGSTYVAYLFAHNDGDGDFGDGTQDIIKCGSVTLDGSGQGAVDLGWEPQWVMYKRTDGAGNWIITDSMRGWTALPNQAGASLLANNSVAEGAYSPASYLNSSGFLISGSASQTYIYIAIRRGPMAVPESATDVFAIDTYNATPLPTFESSFVTDMALYKHSSLSQDWKAVTRLLGATRLVPNSTTAETGESDVTWDFMNGWYSNSGTASTVYSWMWKRAPNYFDVVAYAGAGAAQTINHNLGVAPEMIWVKVRDFATSWTVFHKDLGIDKWLNLDNTNTVQTASGLWGTSDPDATTFGLGLNTGLNNGSGRNYIAYLFASLDGISKVGSVTIQSGSTTVDCGFSGGPRFVLLKRTDGTSSWNLFDSERGIVAGNDPYLNLNQTAAEITGNDLIDPTSSGFTLTSLWTAGQTWIYYAIA